MTDDRRPRERMVYSAAQLLRRGGVAAVGLREVARHADALAGLGVPAARAGELATLMICALEGAILISRAERSPRALEAMTRQLAPLLDDAAGHPSHAPRQVTSMDR
jgi:hypothetical protein